MICLLPAKTGSAKEPPPARPRERDVSGTEVTVEARTYAACTDVVDSDHKPVCALLDVTLPHLAAPQSRRLAASLLQGVPSFREAGAQLPLSLSVDSLTLHQVRKVSIPPSDPGDKAAFKGATKHMCGCAAAHRCCVHLCSIKRLFA